MSLGEPYVVPITKCQQKITKIKNVKHQLLIAFVTCVLLCFYAAYGHITHITLYAAYGHITLHVIT